MSERFDSKRFPNRDEALYNAGRPTSIDIRNSAIENGLFNLEWSAGKNALEDYVRDSVFRASDELRADLARAAEERRRNSFPNNVIPAIKNTAGNIARGAQNKADNVAEWSRQVENALSRQRQMGSMREFVERQNPDFVQEEIEEQNNRDFTAPASTSSVNIPLIEEDRVPAITKVNEETPKSKEEIRAFKAINHPVRRATEAVGTFTHSAASALPFVSWLQEAEQNINPNAGKRIEKAQEVMSRYPAERTAGTIIGSIGGLAIPSGIAMAKANAARTAEQVAKAASANRLQRTASAAGQSFGIGAVHSVAGQGGRDFGDVINRGEDIGTAISNAAKSAVINGLSNIPSTVVQFNPNYIKQFNRWRDSVGADVAAGALSSVAEDISRGRDISIEDALVAGIIQLGMSGAFAVQGVAQGHYNRLARHRADDQSAPVIPQEAISKMETATPKVVSAENAHTTTSTRANNDLPLQDTSTQETQTITLPETSDKVRVGQWDVEPNSTREINIEIEGTPFVLFVDYTVKDPIVDIMTQDGKIVRRGLSPETANLLFDDKTIVEATRQIENETQQAEAAQQRAQDLELQKNKIADELINVGIEIEIAHLHNNKQKLSKLTKRQKELQAEKKKISNEIGGDHYTSGSRSSIIDGASNKDKGGASLWNKDEHKKGRASTKIIKAGAATETESGIIRAVGNKQNTATDGANSTETTFALVDFNDLIPSNFADGTINDLYNNNNSGFQVRDRASQASIVSAHDRAKGFNGIKITESADTQGGAPIISRGGIVVSGNGRVQTLELMRGQYNNFDKYTDYLRRNADKFGIDPAAINENSVLVRVANDSDLLLISNEGNAPQTQDMSISEQARQDVRMVRDNIGGFKDKKEFRDYLLQFIPNSQKSDVPKLNNRVEAALIELAYGSDLNVLFGDIGQENVIKLRNALVSNGIDYLNARTSIGNAEVFNTLPDGVVKYLTARNSGDLSALSSSNQDIFSQKGVSDNIAYFIAQNNRNEKKLGDMINAITEYLNIVSGQQQSDFDIFGNATIKTSNDMFADINQILSNIDAGTVYYDKANTRKKNNKIGEALSALLNEKPTIKVNSGEVEAFYRGHTPKERNALVSEWINDKDLFGSYVNADTGTPIRYGARSVKEVLHHGAEQQKAALLEFVPELIENGIHVSTVSKNEYGQISHQFVARANIDGTDYAVRFYANDSGDGKLYYNHELLTLEEIRIAPASSRYPTQTQGALTGALSKIADTDNIQTTQAESQGVNENSLPDVLFEKINSAIDNAIQKREANRAEAETALKIEKNSAVDVSELNMILNAMGIETKTGKIEDNALGMIQDGKIITIENRLGKFARSGNILANTVFHEAGHAMSHTTPIRSLYEDFGGKVSDFYPIAASKIGTMKEYQQYLEANYKTEAARQEEIIADMIRAYIISPQAVARANMNLYDFLSSQTDGILGEINSVKNMSVQERIEWAQGNMMAKIAQANKDVIARIDEKIKAKTEADKALDSIMGAVRYFRSEFLTKNYGVMHAIRKAPKQTKKELENYLSRKDASEMYADNVAAILVDMSQENILAMMDRFNLTAEQAAEKRAMYFILNRVSNGKDREFMLNTGFLTKAKADLMLEQISQIGGQEKEIMEFVGDFQKNLVQQAFSTVARGKEAFAKEQFEFMLNNEFYATFTPAHRVGAIQRKAGQFIDEDMPSTVSSQGSTSDLFDPVIATVLKIRRMAKTVEVNNAKLQTLDLLTKYAPKTIYSRRVLNNAGMTEKLTLYNEDTRPASQGDIGIIRVKRGGQMFEYEVDKTIAHAFDSSSPSNILTRTLGAFGRFNYYTQILYSPLWQLSNFVRDMHRNAKNVHPMWLYGEARAYCRYFKMKFNAGYRKETFAEMREMGTYQNPNKAYNYDGIIKQMLTDPNVSAADRETSAMLAQFNSWFAKTTAKRQDMFRKYENRSKATGYTLLRDKYGNEKSVRNRLRKLAGMKDDVWDSQRLEHGTRTLIGTPFSVSGGADVGTVGAIFPYFRSITTSWFADMGHRYNPTINPDGLIGVGANVANDMLSAFLGAALRYGLFPEKDENGSITWKQNENIREMFGMISNYERRFFRVIPLMMAGNRVVFLRIPIDDVSRPLQAAAQDMFYAFMAGENKIEAAQEIALNSGTMFGDIIDAQTPSPNPIMLAGARAIETALGGNPFDHFRGQRVYTNQERENLTLLPKVNIGTRDVRLGAIGTAGTDLWNAAAGSVYRMQPHRIIEEFSDPMPFGDDLEENFAWLVNAINVSGIGRAAIGKYLRISAPTSSNFAIREAEEQQRRGRKQIRSIENDILWRNVWE